MSLKELLSERKITCAHVIDDAFDEEPALPLTAGQVQEVLERIDAAGMSALCSLFGYPDESEDLVREALQDIERVRRVFEARTSLPGNTTGILFSEHERYRTGKLEQLRPLLESLESWGVKCLKFGAAYDPQGSEEPQLFFVDLRLREGTVVANHEDAAKAFAALRSVHRQSKPFVFLMSSQSGALGPNREEFRRAADLFQSEFEDIDKRLFADQPEFTRILTRYTQAMPQLAKLRDSMGKVRTAVDLAADSVLKELRALDLADYFVLYKNTTAIEKVGLGNYVVDMLLEYLAHEVEGADTVWELADELSALKFDELPRIRFGASPAAIRLYSASMLHSPKMLIAEDRIEKGPKQGYFFTGDILFEGAAFHAAEPDKAFAVISPACDLVRPRPGRSILVCEGKAYVWTLGAPLMAPDGMPLAVVPHPRDQTKYLAIEWDKKRLHVWDDQMKQSFREGAPFIRVSRLRPEYALQLQHAVTSDLTRVGTQKPPSALMARGLKCFVRDLEQWHEVFFERSPDAAALSDLEVSPEKKFTTFMVSDPALNSALAAVKIWVEAHAEVATRAAIERVLADDSRELIRNHRQKVPIKGTAGGGLDITAYPLQSTDAVHAKAVGLVRGVACASEYAQIAHGQLRNARQMASVVFRWEETLVDSGPIAPLEGEAEALPTEIQALQ